MNTKNVNVKVIYTRLMTSAICLIMGLSAEAQLNRIKPANKTKVTTQAMDAEQELILIGDNTQQNKKISLSKDGPGSGGGGNSCALSISQNKIRLFSILENSNILDESDVKALKIKLASTQYFQIKDRKKMKLNGEQKDAINYPAQNRIDLSAHFCKTELADVSTRSMSLLFHEFLGLIKKDDKQYQISGELLSYLSNASVSENQFRSYLQDEMKKDLKGQKSIYQGAVLKKHQELLENGRYHSADLPEVSWVQTSSESMEGPTRSCDIFYDKNGKKIEDRSQATYQLCNNYSKEEYIVTLKFGHGFSGGWVTETLKFVYTENVDSYTVRGVSDPEMTIPKKLQKLDEETVERTCEPFKLKSEE
jgi:hypothetical protein